MATEQAVESLQSQLDDDSDIMVSLELASEGLQQADLVRVVPIQAVEAEIGPKREAYLSIRADDQRLDALLPDLRGLGLSKEIASALRAACAATSACPGCGSTTAP